MSGYLKNFINNEDGQAIAEYGLVLGILATGAILFILALRYSIENLVYVMTTILSKVINDVLIILK